MIFVAFVEERYETDLDVEGGEVELFGPFETEEQAEIWAYNERRKFHSSRDFWRVVNTKKVYTGEDKIQRERLLSKLMLQMPREWRQNWCRGQACGCMGCSNYSGKLSQYNFEKYEWEAWVKEHPEFCGRK